MPADVVESAESKLKNELAAERRRAASLEQQVGRLRADLEKKLDLSDEEIDLVWGFTDRMVVQPTQAAGSGRVIDLVAGLRVKLRPGYEAARERLQAKRETPQKG